MTEHFHFTGICGTAMGSAAAAMKKRGFKITGSDQAIYPPMSTFLEEAGIPISEGYRAEHLGGATKVVIGNAISRGNPEAEAALSQQLHYLSLPEVLKEYFLRGKKNLVVSGTHGKTTTTSILTWILEQAGHSPSYLIGGIPRNFSAGARFNDSQFCVLEGDEYDTAFFDKRSKFLHYLPHLAILNNIEFDHADIYQNLNEIKTTFRRLLNIIPQNGLALLNGDDQNCLELLPDSPAPTKTVGFAPSCDLQITDPSYQPESTTFSLADNVYEIPLVGEFNVRNAAMAISAALFVGLNQTEIQAGLSSFEGIARRQEEKGSVRGVTVVDDFAHHPTAISLAISALRQKYPGRRIWVIFEPRSNTTRRNVFQKELANALAEADRVTLPEIPDADKVPPSERLDTDKLQQDIQSAGTPCQFLPRVSEIVELVSSEAIKGDLIAILSNGGFEGIHQKILERLKTKEN